MRCKYLKTSISGSLSNDYCIQKMPNKSFVPLFAMCSLKISEFVLSHKRTNGEFDPIHILTVLRV